MPVSIIFRLVSPLLIDKIRDEEDYLRVKFIKMDLGHQFPRKKTYIESEKSLETYLNFTENRRYGVDFVFGLVHRLFYIRFN